MGMFKPFSGDWGDDLPISISPEPKPIHAKSVKRAGNPNPENFRINKLEQIGKFTIVEVNYPDCRNYEGNKILVFERIPKKFILDWKYLDPHFRKPPHPSPIARFEPTQKGWKYAVKFCKTA